MELIDNSVEQNRKYLVFTSIGNHANITQWFGASRNFDIWITRYSEQEHKMESSAEYFNIRKGGKFQNLKYAIDTWPEIFKKYDYVWVADDDISLSAAKINKLFQVTKDNSINASQPAFDRRGKISYEATIENPLSKIRYTNFVEMTCPVIERQSLEYFMQNFDTRLTGYGTDWLMSHYLHQKSADVKFAIIDIIRCLNPRDGAKGGQREINLLQPHAERRRVFEQIKEEVGMTADGEGVQIYSAKYDWNPLSIIIRVSRKYVVDRIVSRTLRLIREFKSQSK